MTGLSLKLAGASIIIAVAASAAAATPWFTQDPRTLPEGKWRVEEHLLSTRITDSLVDGDRVPFKAGKDASAVIVHTRVRYGVRDDLTVFVDLPWIHKTLTPNDGADRSNSGFGDMVLLAKYKYHDDKPTATRRAVAGYLKANTGEHRDLPAPLATGSGTTDWGLIHLWEWNRGSATWYASAGYVLTGNQADGGRNPGDLAFLNLAAERKLGAGPWSFVWELNGRYEGKASRAGETVAASGASTVSFSPGVQYTRPLASGKAVTFEAGVQIPVLERGDLAAAPDHTAYLGGYVVF